DVHAEWLLDEEYGICPPVLPPQRARGYHSLPRWMAEFRQRREFIAEQIRLLYVACTRAADRLFLAACTRTATPPKWSDPSARLSNRAIIRATSPLAWLGPLIPRLTGQ